MTLKTLLAALALTILPGLAAAAGCSHGSPTSETASMSCAEGTILDAETNTCVPLTTG